jgi:murein DD-endopeptidase MepM/ murein hydrolase activator NlpD
LTDVRPYTGAVFGRYSFFLCLFVCLSAALFAAEPCTLSPAKPAQGTVVRLTCNAQVSSAHMGERTVPLFKQASGEYLGLMPIPANHAPGSSEITFFSSIQQLEQTSPITISDAFFATQNVNLAPRIASLHNTPEEVELLKGFRQNLTDIRYWQDRFIEPVDGCMVSPFGVKRYRNHKPTGDYHGGVDLRGAAGTPVHAAADGTVKFAQLVTVLGNTVGLDHGQGVETIYMHMSKLAVEPGVQVKQGDVLGYVGTTGRSSGPHLHWTLYVNGVQVNPGQWVKLTACAK